MMTTKVKFTDVQNIENFVKITNKYPFKIILKSGKFILDAKSIMSLFTLTFSETVDLIAETDDDKGLFNEIASYRQAV